MYVQIADALMAFGYNEWRSDIMSGLFAVGGFYLQLDVNKNKPG